MSDNGFEIHPAQSVAAPGLAQGQLGNAPVPARAPAPVPARAPLGALSLVTFVSSFFIGYLAFIFGIFALRQNWVKGTRGNGLAWAGIILSVVLGTVQFFALWVIVSAFAQNVG